MSGFRHVGGYQGGTMESIVTSDIERVRVVEIRRPETRNAIDSGTADALFEAFREFDVDNTVDVAVLTGADGTFCSGADLGAIAEDDIVGRIGPGEKSPLGPVRMNLRKPVVAAIEGFAVAGGLELALWCDLRVAARDAVLGVFCRRFGVPLVDMGTIRLPRLIGHSRAMDLILTGRGVEAPEALAMGLINRIVEPGEALHAALELARGLSALPQACLRNDRRSAIEQWDLSTEDAVANEARLGMQTIASGETVEGARSFREGVGRHGEPV
jgi:enoyl-CoA hydratase